MTIRKADLDALRESPLYTVPEAARHLDLPPTTVRHWSKGCEGKPRLIEPSLRLPLLLSFLNLTELHVLASVRRVRHVDMPAMQRTLLSLVAKAQSPMEGRHPLLSRTLTNRGLAPFIARYGKLAGIGPSGQAAIRRSAFAALRGIDRDEAGVPVRLHPLAGKDPDEAFASISLDPAVSVGRPVIAGTGLATAHIAERHGAGESIEELAKDYEREAWEIEAAVRFELTTS